MTISISVSAPDNKRAKVTRSDGVESFVEPGTSGSFCVHDGAPSLTVEEVEPDADQAPRSGGSGHGDPDKP